MRRRVEHALFLVGVGHNPVLPLSIRPVRCNKQAGVQHGSRFGMRCWTLDRGLQVHLRCRVHHLEHWLVGPVATMSSGAPVAWSREIWWGFRSARKRQRWAGISFLSEVRSSRAMRVLRLSRWLPSGASRLSPTRASFPRPAAPMTPVFVAHMQQLLAATQLFWVAAKVL